MNLNRKRKDPLAAAGHHERWGQIHPGGIRQKIRCRLEEKNRLGNIYGCIVYKLDYFHNSVL